jgi:hypothetical protein
MEELVRRGGTGCHSANLNTGGKTSKRSLFPTDLQNLMPHLGVCDPRDCRVAFISRGQPQEVSSGPATQVQTGGGIFDTGKPTGIRWRESTRSMANPRKRTGPDLAWTRTPESIGFWSPKANRALTWTRALRFKTKTESSLDSDSGVRARSGSDLDSGSWFARAWGFAGGCRHLSAGLRLGKEQPPPQGGGRWS